MKRVAVITDISGLGNCSGSTDIAVLSVMGIECCLIPTVVLSAQTGFKESYATVIDNSLSSIFSSLQKISPQIDAILVGLKKKKNQTECILSVVKDYSEKGISIITDPIIGDGGKRFNFVTDDMLYDIRKTVENSTIITPNVTEFCLLTETDYCALNDKNDKEKYDFLAQGCTTFFDKGVRSVLITGIELSNGKLSNLIVSRDGYSFCQTERYGGSYSGTGDLFTALVCGHIVNGLNIEEAVKKATCFVTRVLSECASDISDRNYGIHYQKYLRELTE